MQNESLIQGCNLTFSIMQLTGARPPNINCTDTTGNTPMHCVSYRDHCDAAVLLLQHGADTKIKNSKDLLPLEVAQSPQMRQLLDIKPVKVSAWEGCAPYSF